METNKPTTAIILDLRNQKKDNTYPLKLRVTYNREPRLFGIKIKMHDGTIISSMSIDQIEEVKKNINNNKAKEEIKEIGQRLTAIELNAIDIIKDLKQFSFESFALHFTGKRGDPGNVFKAFEAKIADLHTAGRIGTELSYTCAKNSIKKHLEDNHKTDKLMFDDLNTKFLKSYESWFIGEKHKSLASLGMYLRNLRALHNEAIRNGSAKAENYSFGTGKYQIPAPRNIKKALTMADIKTLFEYEPATAAQTQYRDLWVFSYLCNGANLKDVCLLKYSDISDSAITFRREKTAHTNRRQIQIVAANTDRTKEIIEKWGNKPQDPGSYVFPYVNSGCTPLQLRYKIQDITARVNKAMKEIATAKEIKAHITSYTARHSYASILKNSGVPVQFISESLGHSNVLTTQSYLNSLEDSARMKIAENLTNF